MTRVNHIGSVTATQSAVCDRRIRILQKMLWSRVVALGAIVGYADATVDCGNGNQCLDGQTCLGRDSNLNNTVQVGLQYGCNVNSVACPASHFACPAETTCNKTQATFECHRDHTVAQNATLSTKSARTSSMTSLLQKGKMTGVGPFSSGRVGSSGMCAYIADDLPSECQCKDDVSTRDIL